MRSGLALVLSLSVVAGCSLVFSTDSGDTADEGSLCVGALPDGTLEGDEECDDGNQESDDACTHLCRFARCGDGIVRNFVESCDNASDTCENCVTCDDRLQQNHAGMADGRCYIVHRPTISWQDARLACMETYKGELAALDAMPNADAQAAVILKTLNASPIAASEDVPLGLWLGMEFNNGWSWLGSNQGVIPQWEGVVPTNPSGRPITSLENPITWVPTNQAEQHPSLCMRTALPEFNPSSRMLVSETTKHIYIEQIGTLRTSAGVGTYDEHKAFCQTRKANLASFEDIEDAALVATIVSNRPSYIGARRDPDLNSYFWDGSGQPVDQSLWEVDSGPDDIPDFSCAALTSAGELKVENCGLNSRFAICEWD